MCHEVASSFFFKKKLVLRFFFLQNSNTKMRNIIYQRNFCAAVLAFHNAHVVIPFPMLTVHREYVLTTGKSLILQRHGRICL